jgi:hypothetical protein
MEHVERPARPQPLLRLRTHTNTCNHARTIVQVTMGLVLQPLPLLVSAAQGLEHHSQLSHFTLHVTENTCVPAVGAPGRCDGDAQGHALPSHVPRPCWVSLGHCLPSTLLPTTTTTTTTTQK